MVCAQGVKTIVMEADAYARLPSTESAVSLSNQFGADGEDTCPFV